MAKGEIGDKIKRILLKWWFWLIVYLFFGIFFGVGGGIGEYIAIFAFVIAVILVGISIIKRIQKSSIGDYWKISWTIIGIILIAIVAFFILKENLPEEYNRDNSIRNMLERDGYEVLDVHFTNLTLNETWNETWVSVKMKSLGDLNEQVWNALISMSVVYEGGSFSRALGKESIHIDKYIVTLLTPTNECYYSIEGEILRNYQAYLDGEKLYYSNGTEGDGASLRLYINSLIEKETERCS